MESESLWTTKQVAEFLGVSRQRVQQLREENKLPGLKLGVWMYSEAEVRAYGKIYRPVKRRPPLKFRDE